MQEGGPVTSMSMQTAKGSMMGATTAMMKQRQRSLIWYTKTLEFNI
jgi:hypothetical protein